MQAAAPFTKLKQAGAFRSIPTAKGALAPRGRLLSAYYTPRDTHEEKSAEAARSLFSLSAVAVPQSQEHYVPPRVLLMTKESSADNRKTIRASRVESCRTAPALRVRAVPRCRCRSRLQPE